MSPAPIHLLSSSYRLCALEAAAGEGPVPIQHLVRENFTQDSISRNRRLLLSWAHQSINNQEGESSCLDGWSVSGGFEQLVSVLEVLGDRNSFLVPSVHLFQRQVEVQHVLGLEDVARCNLCIHTDRGVYEMHAECSGTFYSILPHHASNS